MDIVVSVCLAVMCDCLNLFFLSYEVYENVQRELKIRLEIDASGFLDIKHVNGYPVQFINRQTISYCSIGWEFLVS